VKSKKRTKGKPNWSLFVPTSKSIGWQTK
jgi:hypothetical protein